jgi:outer membrane immunogenic protein
MTYHTRDIVIIAMAAVFAVIAGPATAADLLPGHTVPLAAPPLPTAPVGMTWSGFYVGGNVGAALSPDDLSINDLSEEQNLSLSSSNDTKLIGGVHGGYNWQTGPWVLGVEGDFDFAENVNFLASARGRLGWGLGNWLFYGTGGVAFIDTDNNFVVVSAEDGPFSFNGGNNKTGFVVGGGIDYKVAPHLSLGVEGLFYNFGSDDAHLVADNEPFVLKQDQDFTVVRARLTYHFNSGY